MAANRRIVGFDEIGREGVALVGGKIASLGEMTVHLTAAGVRVAGRPVGLCGQRPGDDPDFSRFLVNAGTDSISVAPDRFAAVQSQVAAAEGNPGGGTEAARGRWRW